MKRFLFLLCMVQFVVLAFAQSAVPLDTGLSNGVQFFESRITRGSRLAVFNIRSPSQSLSEYIMEELTIHFVNRRYFTVVDRSNIELIQQELHFQLSGEVSDETALSIGKMIGAQTIISGSVEPFEDVFRLRIRAIDVESAVIQSIYSAHILGDRFLTSLIEGVPASGNNASINNNTPPPAQNMPDNSTVNSILFIVEVTSMTQDGTRRADSITVPASDPREAERQAEAEFRRNNSSSTFIRAVASVPAVHLQNRSESRESVPDTSSTAITNPVERMLFTVEVTSMTQGGTRMVDSITVLASDPREAERQAEAEFRRTNSRSTFIRAVAIVPEVYLLNIPESMEPVPSASRAVSPNPDGKMLFSVEVTSMTQGGTRRVNSITVLASDPREAEREAEAEFRKTNSRSTFIRAVTR